MKLNYNLLNNRAAGLGGLGGAATGGNQTTGNNQSGAGNIFNNQSAGGMLNNPDILNMMRNLMGGQQQGLFVCI